MSSKEHWERIYATKRTDAVSWYQEHAVSSLRLIHATGVPKNAAIIDVGGGASILVDDLLADGYSNVTVLDLSGAALSAAKLRLGPRSAAVHWARGRHHQGRSSASALMTFGTIAPSFTF